MNCSVRTYTAADVQAMVEIWNEVAEPSQAARIFALNNDLAASDWLACEVYAPTGELVGKLAYNGCKI